MRSGRLPLLAPPSRIALPISGDNASAKAKLINLIDEIGFDAVDAGRLAESWRQQPATPVYGTNLDLDGVRKALADARQERGPEWRSE